MCGFQKKNVKTTIYAAKKSHVTLHHIEKVAKVLEKLWKKHSKASV